MGAKSRETLTMPSAMAKAMAMMASTDSFMYRWLSLRSPSENSLVIRGIITVPKAVMTELAQRMMRSDAS